MKRFCVVLLLVGLIVVPQQLMLESFKRQSTFILDDDLEMILTPWMIYDVQGWRLFTKLSNLTGSSEQLMNIYSDQSFMIGALLPEIVPSLRTAFFWSTLKNTVPYYVSIDPLGLGSVDGYGSVYGIWNQFIDVDGDGNPDIHNYATEHEADFYDELRTSTAAVLTYDLGASIIGFNYNRNKMFLKEDYFDTLNFRVYDLYPNMVESLNAVAGMNETDKYVYDYPSNMYSFSFLLKDLAGYRTGLTIGADFYKESMDYKGFTNYFEDLAPNNQNYMNNESSNYSGYYQWVNPVTQFIVSLNALKKDEGGLNELGFNFFYGMGGDYGRDREEGYIEENITGIMGFIERGTYNEYAVDSVDLSYNEMGFGLFGRIIRKLGENVEFGIGLNISTSQNSLTYDGIYEEYYIETYNDGDNEVLDSDDYTETGSFNATYNIEEKHSWTTYRVPVGVEIAITPKKNWFIRFGANPMKTLHSSVEKFELKSYTNEVIINIEGDGDTTVTINPPDLPPEYRVSEYYESHEGTNFSYGLGWHPNNNISIDFITMFAPTGTILDLSWIRSLRISTTLKFY